jgi:hypothetical protein
MALAVVLSPASDDTSAPKQRPPHAPNLRLGILVFSTPKGSEAIWARRSALHHIQLLPSDLKEFFVLQDGPTRTDRD